MVIKVGALQQRSYGLESTYGDGTAPTSWIGLVQDFTDNSEKHLERLRHGDTYESNQLESLEYTFQGSMDVIPQEGKFLRFAFNHLVTTGSPNYVHTLDFSGTTDLSSMNFEDYNGGGTAATRRRYPGLKFSKTTLSCSEKDFLHFRSDWMAKTVEATSSGAATVTASSKTPYLFNQGTISIDGGTVAEVRSLEANINTPLDPAYYVKSGAAPLLNDLKLTEAFYDGTVTVDFVDHTQYLKFLNDGATPAGSATRLNMQFVFSRSATDYIQLTLSGCDFKSASPDGGIDGVLNQALRFEGIDGEAKVANTGSPL